MLSLTAGLAHVELKRGRVPFTVQPAIASRLSLCIDIAKQDGAMRETTFNESRMHSDLLNWPHFSHCRNYFNLTDCKSPLKKFSFVQLLAARLFHCILRKQRQ